MRKVVSVFLLVCVCFATSVAQEGNCSEPSKKAAKKFNKLVDQYHLSSTETVNKIKKLLEKYPDFVEGYYFLGTHYRKGGFKTSTPPHLKPKLLKSAIKYYKKVAEICPEFSGHLAYYWVGVIEHKDNKNYKAAAEYFKLYIDNEKEPNKEYKRVATNLVEQYYTKEKLLKNPVPFDPKVLKGVSSMEDEYLPMLTPDNEYLYFTRKRNSAIDLSRPQRNGNDSREWFSRSKKMSVDSFSYGMVLKDPFNMERLNGDRLNGLGGVCLTPDNKTMFITAQVAVVPSKGQGYPNTSLYMTNYVDGKWTPLKSVGKHINDENNEPTWEGQPTMSSDGKLVIFASARPSSISIGEKGYERFTLDLFSITKLPNGTWSEPKSLGPLINTKGHEKTPFLHTDSKTLYFASDGHPGMGGSDLFYTRMDENGNWTKPVNLGYPINTEKEEHGLMVSLDGKYAYMSGGTRNDGKGGLQIIHFPLHKDARPEKVVFMRGVLKDEQGNVVKNGKLKIKNQSTGEVQEGLVDKETGEYVAVLTVKDPKKAPIKPSKIELELDGEMVSVDYGSTIQKVNGKNTVIPPGAKVVQLNDKEAVLKKGDKIRKVDGISMIIPKDKEIVIMEGEQVVLPKKQAAKSRLVKAGVKNAELEAQKQNFIITASGDNMALSTSVVKVNPDEVDGAKKVRSKPTKIKKSKKGETIRLNEVNFATSSALLNGISMDVLDDLVSFLKERSSMRIAIHGHTDNVGDPKKNLMLSQERAKNVMQYLIEQGIDANRLKSNGFGETKPKKSNSTEEGRALNRRVEFVILST